MQNNAKVVAKLYWIISNSMLNSVYSIKKYSPHNYLKY